MRETKLRIGLWSLSVLLATGKEANAAPDRWLNAKIEEAIQVARTDPPKAPEREEALERITWLTYGVPPSSISSKTISDMVSLLDMPDDAVRFYIAAALRHLGRRARLAIPKLLAILPEAECVEGDLTSAATIRPALESMGVKPPPSPSYEQCQAAKQKP